ncbi:MAG: type II secretion system F family protein [Acidimicrobiales bacterium]
MSPRTLLVVSLVLFVLGPRPDRAREIRRAPWAGRPTPATARTHASMVRLSAGLGRRLTSMAGRLPGVTAREAPFVVLIAIAAAGATIVSPVLGAGVVVAGPVMVGRRRIRSRRRVELAVERGLPETIELLSLVVGAGGPVRTALELTAAHCPEPHAGALSEVVRRVGAGEPLTRALDGFADHLGPAVRALTTAIVAAEADGVALLPALERAADDARRRRRIRAEEAARRLPVLLLFPLVVCILPAFALLTVVPLLAGSIADLRLPG